MILLSATTAGRNSADSAAHQERHAAPRPLMQCCFVPRRLEGAGPNPALQATQGCRCFQQEAELAAAAIRPHIAVPTLSF